MFSIYGRCARKSPPDKGHERGQDSPGQRPPGRNLPKPNVGRCYYSRRGRDVTYQHQSGRGAGVLLLSINSANITLQEKPFEINLPDLTRRQTKSRFSIFWPIIPLLFILLKKLLNNNINLCVRKVGYNSLLISNIIVLKSSKRSH